MNAIEYLIAALQNIAAASSEPAPITQNGSAFNHPARQALQQSLLEWSEQLDTYSKQLTELSHQARSHSQIIQCALPETILSSISGCSLFVLGSTKNSLVDSKQVFFGAVPGKILEACVRITHA